MTGPAPGPRALAFMRTALLLLLAFAAIRPAAFGQDGPPRRPVRLGFLAHLGVDKARQMWEPTARYLESEIPTERFEVVPLRFEEVDSAVAERRVDFVLTNPWEYIIYETRHQAMRILTLQTFHAGIACKLEGAVILARADRTDLVRLSDLKGQRFAAVDPGSFGGWLLAYREIARAGIDPKRDFRELLWEGTHGGVTQAILDGKADAGTVRSDELERIDASKFRILNRQPPDASYPLPRSTELYPEWPLAAVRGTPDDLAQKVTIALLKLSPADPASKAAESAGWTIPQNYRPVHEALRELKLPPYDTVGQITLAEAVRSHRWWVLSALVLILGLAGATAYVVRLNRRLSRLQTGLQSQFEERERVETARKDSEALYHSLVETLPQNIFRKGCDERFTFVNGRFCATIGRTRDEVIGRTDFDFFPPELAEKYRGDDLKVIESGLPLEAMERHVTPDGKTHYVQVIKAPVVDSHGEVAGIQGIFWDVTGKKRAEEELARSEERFAMAVRGSNDGLWDWNVETDEIYYSPRFKELLGFPDKEFPNTVEAHHGRIHPDDRERFDQRIRAHLRLHAPFDVEYRAKTRSGEYLWYQARGQAVWNPSGRATRMAGSLSDITLRKDSEEKLREQNLQLQEMARSERRAHQELKQAQSRMVQTAKLAGLGEMVAGVAHEINNPLAFVSNNVCVLQRDLADVEEVIALYRQADDSLAACNPEVLARVRELWDRVDLDYTLHNLPGLLSRTREGLNRIQQIVKDLRVFARLDESDLNEVDLNAGMGSTINIVLGHAKKKQVTIEQALNPLPLVTCYPAKINQVIMNLLSNAIDASHEAGVVTIRTNVESGGVLIEVEDRGTGIEPAVRERIFDPFFTTKPVGVGTGLGLSISYGIVQDHGGTIEVDSTPGQGTTFRVHLPLKPLTRPRASAARFTAEAVAKA